MGIQKQKTKLKCIMGMLRRGNRFVSFSKCFGFLNPHVVHRFLKIKIKINFRNIEQIVHKFIFGLSEQQLFLGSTKGNVIDKIQLSPPRR